MATVIDAKEWIFTILTTGKSESKFTLSGNIYIDKKPAPGLEDIVINDITMDNEFWQAGIFNVNVYVPDLEIHTGGKTLYVPNRARLKTLTNAIYPLLKDVTSKGVYRLWIESTGQEQEEIEQAHFMNFRVRLNAIN